ncbi:MAG: hypothetical protein ACLQIQ_09600 [Beijerinckiaceae bacterium]
MYSNGYFISRYSQCNNGPSGWQIVSSYQTELLGFDCEQIRGLPANYYGSGYPAVGGTCVANSYSTDVKGNSFYALNTDGTGHVEDVISNYASQRWLWSGGLIDGSNSPTGSCIQADYEAINGGAAGVDCVHALNQCFGAYGASGVYNIDYGYSMRCGEHVSSTSWGTASSGGYAFVGAAPGNGAVAFNEVVYDISWPGEITGSYWQLFATQASFTPVTPISFVEPCT